MDWLLHAVQTTASWLSGGLGGALLYLLVVAIFDVVLGVIAGHVVGPGLSLRKLRDFIVTTLGWQHTIAFIGALLLMYVHRDPITQGTVVAIASFEATAIVPDVYDKLRALLGAAPPTPTH